MFGLITLRISNITNANEYIPFINSTSIQSFLSEHEYSVVLFETTKNNIQMMDFAIKHYQNRVGFARTDYELGKERGCQADPCLLCFRGEKVLPINSILPHNSVSFVNWIDHAMNYSTFRARTPESLRQILIEEEPKILAIGYDERPSNISEDENVILVDPKIFEQFNLSDDVFEKGIYVFRKDKIIVPYSGNITYDNRPLFPQFSEDLETEKPYWGFFFYDDMDMVGAQISVNVFHDLYPLYKDKIELFLVSTQLTQNIINDFHFQKGTPPYFVLLDSRNLSNLWIAQNDEIKSVKGIQTMIERVYSGENFTTYFSAPVPDQPDDIAFPLIVRSNMDEKVLNPERDVMLVSTAPWCKHCKEFKPIFNETAKIIKKANIPIDLYWFDSTKNDLPSYVPPHSSYPSVYFYAKNNKGAVKFPLIEAKTIDGILKWLAESATEKFEIPEFDEEAHLAEIKKNQK